LSIPDLIAGTSAFPWMNMFLWSPCNNTPVLSRTRNPRFYPLKLTQHWVWYLWFLFPSHSSWPSNPWESHLRVLHQSADGIKEPWTGWLLTSTSATMGLTWVDNKSSSQYLGGTSLLVGCKWYNFPAHQAAHTSEHQSCKTNREWSEVHHSEREIIRLLPVAWKIRHSMQNCEHHAPNCTLGKVRGTRYGSTRKRATIHQFRHETRYVLFAQSRYHSRIQMHFQTHFQTHFQSHIQSHIHSLLGNVRINREMTCRCWVPTCTC
jgi:hypothetical protein